MDKNTKKMIKAFDTVKQMGFIVSNRRGNTGIGKTFEDVLNIIENNIDAPDLYEFEIKSQRALSRSRITLFTKAPTLPKNANSYLRDNYGIPDKHFEFLKVLHTSCFHNKFNTHKSGFGFKLNCNDKKEKMFLQIIDLATGKIVSENIYWSYYILHKIVESKIKHLAFVSADSRLKGEIEEFHFNKMILYTGIIFEKLLKFIKKDNGLMFDIRLGAYKSEHNFGKLHDHGSGFRILKSQLEELYPTKIVV